MPQAPATITTEIVERILRVIRNVNAAAAEREVHQVTGKPVGSLLNRRARFFRAFHFLDDSPERCVAAKPLDTNFQCAGLIDRSGVHAHPRQFFNRERFPGNRRLVDKRVAAHHDAIHGNMPAGTHQDDIAGAELARSQHPAIDRARRTVAVFGSKSSKCWIACRPRPTVSPSSISAASTNKVITSAVNVSRMASAATMAMAMESSIVMRRWTRLSYASR